MPPVSWLSIVFSDIDLTLQFCLPNQMLLLHNFMCFSLYNDDPIAVTDPIKEDNPFFFIIELRKKKRLQDE